MLCVCLSCGESWKYDQICLRQGFGVTMLLKRKNPQFPFPHHENYAHSLFFTTHWTRRAGLILVPASFLPPKTVFLHSSRLCPEKRRRSSALFTEFCLRHFLPNFVTAPRCLFISFVTIAAISLSCYLSHNCHILPLFNSTFCRAPPILHGPCVRRYFSASPS